MHTTDATDGKSRTWLGPRLHVVGEGPPGTTWGAACARLGPTKAERLMARLAITGAMGRRLAGLLDEDWPDGLVAWRRGRAHYALRNLQDVSWEERPYQAERMRERAEALLAAARAEGSPILLLGRLVAQAFDLANAPLCSWTRRANGDLLGLLPHPSRRSRWWEDRANAEEAVAFLRSARLALAWGHAEDARGSWAASGDPHDVAGNVLVRAHETRQAALLEARAAQPDRVRLWTARAIVDVGAPGPDLELRPLWLSRHEGAS